MDDQELAKLLKSVGEDPNYIIGTSSTLNADGTVTISGGGRSVNAIAQTAFRSGIWSAKRVGSTWHAWSGNAPVIESESRRVMRSSPVKKDKLGRYIILLDSNFSSGFGNSDQLRESGQKFFENLLSSAFSFKPKRLYTFSNNPGEGISTRGYGSEQIINFFKQKLTVYEINTSQLERVNSVFYWPSFSSDPSDRFSEISLSTINKIKKIAKKYGVIFQGEQQGDFNPANTFFMNKFYKPLHPNYDFVFKDGIRYFSSSFLFLGGPPWMSYADNKISKALFDGVPVFDGGVFGGVFNGVQLVEVGDSAGIPIDVIPAKERLAIFEDNQFNTYVSVVGWEAK